MSTPCTKQGRTACVLLVIALAIPVFAAQKLEREDHAWMQESTGSLGNEKKLQVTRFLGSVRVITGAKSGSYVLRVRSLEPVEKDARKQISHFHLTATRKNGQNILQTVGPLDLAVRAELIVQLPVTTETVHIDTLAGRISVQGKVSHLELRTHGGDIEVDDADSLRAVTLGGSVIAKHRVGDSFIHTGGGDIRVDASTGDLEITSLGGNIWLKAIANGRVDSGGGNIEVVHCAGSLLVRTAGGNISLGEMGGSVTAETGGGSIRIGVAHGGVVASTALGNIELWKLSKGVDARTGMGRITAEFIGGRESMRESALVTSMGDIVVFFAPGAPGTVHAITGASPTHRILSEFPDLKVTNGTAAYGPRSIIVDGAIHGGGPPIEIRTMVGQIELRNSR